MEAQVRENLGQEKVKLELSFTERIVFRSVEMKLAQWGQLSSFDLGTLKLT